MRWNDDPTFDYRVARDGDEWVLLHGEDPIDWFSTLAEADMRLAHYRDVMRESSRTSE